MSPGLHLVLLVVSTTAMIEATITTTSSKVESIEFYLPEETARWGPYYSPLFGDNRSVVPLPPTEASHDTESLLRNSAAAPRDSLLGVGPLSAVCIFSLIVMYRDGDCTSARASAGPAQRRAFDCLVNPGF